MNTILILGLAQRYIENKYPEFKSEVHPLNQHELFIRIHDKTEDEGFYFVSGRTPRQWYYRAGERSGHVRAEPADVKRVQNSPNCFVLLKTKRHRFGTWNSWKEFINDITNRPEDKFRTDNPEEIPMFTQFKSNEIQLMIAMLNGTLIDDSWKQDTNHLKWEVIDYCKLCEVEAAQFGKPDRLMKSIVSKIEKLSPEAAFELTKKCKAFWDDPDRNLQNYAEKIIRPAK